MVKIPEFYRQTPTPAQGGGALIDQNSVPGFRTTAGVAGAQVGRALSQLGQTGQALAQEKFDKLQAYEDTEFKTRFKAKVKGTIIDLSEKAQQVKGHATKGIANVYAKDLENVISSAKEDSPSDAARLWADDWGTDQTFRFSDQLLGYERDEREKASLETFQSLVNDAIRTTYYDPTQAKKNIMEVKSDLLDLADGGVISKERAKAVYQEAKDKIYLAQAQATLDRDPRRFKKAIDRGDYNHLDEENLRSLRKAAESEVRSLDAEDRQKKNEEKAIAKDQLYNLGTYMKDEEASVLSTGRRLRDVDIGNMIRYGEEKGVLRAGTAKEYDNRMRALEETHWIIAETKTEPLQKRLDLAKNRLAPQPGEPGYAEKMERSNLATQAIAQDWKQYLNDPNAYLQSEVDKRIVKSIENGMIDPKDETAIVQARIEIGLAFQEQMGGGVNRVLSNGQADLLHTQFMSASTDEKLAMAQQWEQVFGDHFGQVMAESKLDTGYAVAGQLATDPASRPLARVLMQVSDRKEADFQTGDIKKSDIKKTVRDKFGSSGYGKVLAGLSSAFPDDAAMTEYTNGIRTMLYKAAMHYVETGMDEGSAVDHVVKQFDGLYGTISDADIGYILFPKQSDPGSIQTGLEAAREQVANGLDPQLADLVRQGAIWRNDGDDFILIFEDNLDRVQFGDSVGGYVTDKQGVPIKLTVDDVEAIGRGQDDAAKTLERVISRTMPWRTLAKEPIKGELKRDSTSSASELINRAAIKYDVPAALIQAVMDTESGGNQYALSEAGAMGLMQIMPDTGRRYGLTDPADFYDPVKNVMAGTRYLKDLLDRYNGDVDKAIAAYHQGEGTVDQGLDAVGPKGRNYMNVVGDKYRKLRAGG